ncbi:hypothetical protein AVEN_241609-1 [Araneus ventricosus]|uniref:C2H2-type domain-containing protein n=1 Tax=Araneus ventricosus TaxID=182803 RepID=A0A4Y1ZLX2_ARAVE|nr:hypothetical protein AVEN_120649-1 [Araneus ventricosus]GBL57324.1 hypothetical protein AVEN_241609-1 [Araneus ventricosus]
MDQKTNVDKGITKEDCITEEFLDSVENWWSNDQENRKSAGSQQRNTENEDLDYEHMNMGSKRKITEPEINPSAKRYKYLSHPNNNERAGAEHISPRPPRSTDPDFSHESTEIQKDEGDMKIICLCERTHTGETVFVCTLCAKRFHRYNNLKEHIESHRSKRSKFAKMNFTPHQG